MIITKKAMSRRTVLKGAHAVLALPLLDAMIPAATAWAKTPAKPVRRLGFVYHADGLRPRTMDAAGPGTAHRADADSAAARLRQRPGDGRHEPAAAERLPGDARHRERRIPQRGVRQAHRELGLLSGHDDRPNRGEADRPRDAIAVARARDGSEPARRRVQQRLRVRLSELPLLVVADDPAPLRGASAHRLRPALRRGRQRRRAASGAARAGQACSIRSWETSRGSSSAWARPIAFASISTSRASARSSGRSSVRRQRPPTTRCPTWIDRLASPPRSPITRS